jgi:hypothetical protein
MKQKLRFVEPEYDWRKDFANEFCLFDDYENVLPERLLEFRAVNANGISPKVIALAEILRRRGVSFKLCFPVGWDEKRLRFIDLVVGCIDVAVVNVKWIYHSQRISDIEEMGFTVFSLAIDSVAQIADEIVSMIRQKQHSQLVQKQQQKQNNYASAVV